MTVWKQVCVADRWDVVLPKERTEGVDWSLWERCRFDSMASKLKHGDRLYDVGAEWGDISAVYAKIVGGANVIPFEPHPGIWANMRQIWEANDLETPASYYVGLVGDRTCGPTERIDYDSNQFSAASSWPVCAHAEWWPHRSFRYIHEHSHTTPQVRLDDFAELTELYPKAVTIDVEGYELPVLRGAEKMLLVLRPLVWVSIHQDLMVKHCNDNDADLHRFMDEHGYDGEHLGTDHEEHWLFSPREA